MSIVSDSDILSFLGVSEDYFTVNVTCDVLKMKYTGGALTSVDIADGTYTASTMATAIKTALDTAFTIASTVTWDSSTRKFTLTAPVANTFAYTHTGSDAGTLIGFSQDHAAALSLTSDNAVGDPTALALSIRDAVEAYIEKYCRRTFTSTTYSLEKYSSNGTPYVYLKNYPITAVQLVATGTRDAMYIYNSNTHSYASVSVTATSIILSRDGTTDSTLLFADYSTLSSMVTAINAVGNSWAAAMASSWYNDFKSTWLIPRMGLSAIESNYVYLQIPDKPESDFEIDENNGLIRLGWAPKPGFRNVYITYTAGYSTFSDDLVYAVKIMTKANYDKVVNQTWGISGYKIGDISYDFSSNALLSAGFSDISIPVEAMDILAKYRRRMV